MAKPRAERAIRDDNAGDEKGTLRYHLDVIDQRIEKLGEVITQNGFWRGGHSTDSVCHRALSVVDCGPEEKFQASFFVLDKARRGKNPFVCCIKEEGRWPRLQVRYDPGVFHFRFL